MLELGEMRRKTIDCIRQVVPASRQQAGAQPGVRQAQTRNQEREMTERCDRCGSANVHRINLEMAFAPSKAEPVYVLAKPNVCLDCGLVECSLSEESLRELREGALQRAVEPAYRGTPSQRIA
jgi:hypothetical protein